MTLTKDELLFDNQTLRENQELLLKRVQEAEQSRERTQAHSELLQTQIQELQARKEQDAAQVEQLQESLSQASQPEEMALLKKQIQTALSVERRTSKALEQRMERLELALEHDRLIREREWKETKESINFLGEIIEKRNLELKEALNPPKSLPLPQEKNITPQVVSPPPSRPEQPQVIQRELTIRERKAVAERALAWNRTEETHWELQERIEREIALQNQEIRRYLKLFSITVLVIYGLATLLTYLLGQTRFLILLSIIGASIPCGLSRKVFRSLVRLAKGWDEKSRPVWTFMKASACGAILSVLMFSSLALLAYGKSLTGGNDLLAMFSLWGVMMLYVLSGARMKSVCKALYLTKT